MKGTPAINRIRCLSTVLANQIAAGEVVERPASVVKELLENSLDAGARNIRVDVEQGGARLLRVHDDGCGIHADDLPLALSRHATSKIARLSDLEAVASLGFRGEALPSIASVSRLTLTSRTPDAELGRRIYSDGSAVPSRPEPAPHPVGTTVEVRDLFFNTPARRKFLRTEKTEFRHLEDIVRRLVLSRFDTGLVLRHDNRDVLTLRAAAKPEEQDRRVARVCGSGFMQHAVIASFEAAGLRLRGWLAMPDFSRAQSDLQYFYVNDRIVRDRLLTHAVRQAYGSLIPAGRYPAYVLYLSVDNAGVDVNVHPTKHELRFREARLVHDFIRRSLQRALQAVDGGDAAAGGMMSQRSSGTGLRERPGRYGLTGGSSGSAQPQCRAGGPIPEPEPGCGPLGRALGHLGKTYIVSENEQGLVLVHVAAAREKVLRTDLGREFMQASIRSLPLLLPLSVDVGADWAETAESCAPILEKLGFELLRTGPDSISVRRIPAGLAHADVKGLVCEVLPRLQRRVRSADDRAGLDEVLDAMARQGAASSPELDSREMDTLLRALESNEEAAGAGNHRASSVQITWKELAERFPRRR